MPSSGFKKYFSNTAWMVGGRIFKALIGFTVSIFVARYLGPERFGILNYAISIAMLFSIFSALGMDGIMVRELVGEKDKWNLLLGSALTLRLIGSCVAVGLSVLFLLLTDADRETWVLTLICILSFFFLATDVLRSFYEATVQAKTIVTVEIVQCLISSALRIYFIAVKGDVVWFAVCWLGEWVFIAIGFAVYYLKRQGTFLDWRFDAATAKHIVRESMPLFFSAMAIVVYQQIDRIMLKNMLAEHGNEQVGYYSAALRILPFVILIPQMAAKALAPALIGAHKRDMAEYRKKAQLFMDLMIWMGIALSIVLFLMAGPIMSLFGDAYIESIQLLKIMTSKGLFISMSVASGILIVTEGLQKWSILRSLAGCVLNVFLNYIWIPRWGAVGSAWATVFSFATGSFLIHFFIPDFRAVFFVQIRSALGGPFRLVQFANNSIKTVFNK